MLAKHRLAVRCKAERAEPRRASGFLRNCPHAEDHPRLITRRAAALVCETPTFGGFGTKRAELENVSTSEVRGFLSAPCKP